MSDYDLLNYVQTAINSGAKEITVPIGLVIATSDEMIQEVRRLCRVCGVKIYGLNR